MPDFDPSRSTTAEVVRKAVIPLSRVGRGGWSYSDVLDAAGRDCKDQMPECMAAGRSWMHVVVVCRKGVPERAIVQAAWTYLITHCTVLFASVRSVLYLRKMFLIPAGKCEQK